MLRGLYPACAAAWLALISFQNKDSLGLLENLSRAALGLREVTQPVTPTTTKGRSKADTKRATTKTSVASKSTKRGGASAARKTVPAADAGMNAVLKEGCSYVFGLLGELFLFRKWYRLAHALF
jgi:hypothetical protein